MSSFAFRRPTAQDAEALGAIAAEGTEAYRDFAPVGWEPPHGPPTADQIGDPAGWWLLAEDNAGRPAAYVAFLPAAAHSKRPDATPGLAHLSGLFARPAHHGTGLAGELLRRAHAEARARGFITGRLFCAAGYGRARRFYERQGWRPAGEPFAEPDYGGLELIEYRRECGGSATSPRRPSS